MKKNEYLLPVGAEVVAASGAEAFVAFRNLGIKVKDVPILGAVCHKNSPDQIYFVWACKEDVLHVISLFEGIKVPSGEGWNFAPLHKGQMILYPGWHSYIVDYEKDIGFCVKNLNFYWHEKYAAEEAVIRGYPNAYFKLCKMYLTKENSRLFTLCWLGYDEEKNTLLFVKVFEEEFLEMTQYDVSEFGREPVDIGENVFLHGKSYTLKKDENGLLYLEQSFFNPYLKIVVDNRNKK